MNSEYATRALQYANAVLSEEIPACIYVKQAAQRFINDLQREDLYLDHDAVELWCSKLEKLPHVKGKWRGQLFKLSEWQIFITVNIFGFKWKATEKRRFRDAYIEVPRKNGKSFWFAGIGIGMLTWEEEAGAEVYCGATTEEQAWYVFKPAKQICEALPKLRQKYGLTVNAKTITIIPTGSVFRPIIGDPGDGASPSCAITDEYHEHPDSAQVDTMETGMGAREQPLGLKITTAGSDMGGPCYTKRDDIKQILGGSVVDDAQFGIIYTLDDGDEWDTVDAQKKANPNFGISVDAEFLQGQLLQARRSPLKQSSYKTKHLNLWVGAQAAWMNMLAFQACRKKNLEINQFKGKPCFVAIDLATKTDIASMAILFPPNETRKKYAAFCKHYLPEETVLEVQRYRAWHAEGWLEATPGNVTDFSYIEEDLLKIAREHQIIEIPFDPYQATQFSQRMMDLRLPMIEVGATVKNFSEPMKLLEALILKREIEFTFDPVLMWMFGNVVATLDKKDNIFPNKERYQNKIDSVVSLIMALNRQMVNKPKRPSVYELGPL